MREVTGEKADVNLAAETPANSKLLERDGLLAELEHLVDVAGDGAGALAMISGEAGSGKTSLMNELARRIEPRGRVLIGGCDPLTTPRPLSPLMDIAADPDAHFAGHDLVESDPFSLFADVLDDLKGTIRPTLLVIEDMHWADEATLDFLRYIGRRGSPTPRRWWLAPTARTSWGRTIRFARFWAIWPRGRARSVSLSTR
ncbi:MAG TPA: ATP-binding protein [Acidimicrobiia bacterium]|nr:ATP-binding protein [Acidimicrobiia bacterium]